ncbi:TetR/AcrR family transcriptional regulator [Streptomyces sp. NPDC059467]|uniref:TetR/AcrR family transcriptional regulator n=1 Tax=Streptomyces sp. NPDC059467 TaxID=3346844 RepID=UPI0036BCEE38
MSRPNRRQMYAEQTRTDLTAAARRLFMDNGFAGTSVEAITGAAMVSKGTFYHHFADKKAMFAELYTELIQQVAALGDTTAKEAAAPSGTPALTEARSLALAFLRRSVDDPLHRELMAQAPAVLGEQYRHINETVAQPPIEQLLTVMAARGELKPDTPIATTARLLLACLCEGNHIIATAEDPEDALVHTGRALTLLLSGLTADDTSR